MKTIPNRPASQQGMTMIEVLITLVIVSFGLLGAGALQLMSLQVNQNANKRSQASQLASSIVDAIRTNRHQAMSYVHALGDGVPAASATNITQNDKHVIGSRIAEALPNGRFSVTVTNDDAGYAWPPDVRPYFYDVTVTIQWDEAGRLVDRNEASVAPSEFEMKTQI